MSVAIENKVQTAFRFPPSLISRIKRAAAKERISVNRFVETVLERATEPDWPSLPPDFEISQEISSMACCSGMPSKEDIESDARLSHILRV